MMLIGQWKGSVVRCKCYRIDSYRLYATIGGSQNESNPDKSSQDIDPEMVKLIHAYPTSPSATPYDVLNLKSHDDVNKSQLKQQFFKLAKIYHPDSSHCDGHPLKKSIFGSNEDVLSNSIKEERFKKVLAAYNLLRNPLSKRNYDQYHIGWNDPSNSYFRSNNPNMYDPSNMAYDDFMKRSRSYTANKSGTWEDHYKHGYESAYGFPGDKYWQATETGGFKEEFEKNKKTFLLSTALFISVYFALQLSHLYLYDDFIGGRGKEAVIQSSKMHDKSEQDLFDAYTNYGLGDTKEDRINRFLWWRKLTMILEIGDITDILNYFKNKGVIHKKDGDDFHSIMQYSDKHEIIIPVNNERGEGSQ